VCANFVHFRGLRCRDPLTLIIFLFPCSPLYKPSLLLPCPTYKRTAYRVYNHTIIQSYNHVPQKHICSGRLEVKGESTHHSRDNLVATFSANKLSNKEGFFGTSNPFLKLYRYERKCCVIFCEGVALLCWCYLLLRQIFTVAAIIVRFYGLKFIYFFRLFLLLVLCCSCWVGIVISDAMKMVLTL
jgi:hypothetical protein